MMRACLLSILLGVALAGTSGCDISSYCLDCAANGDGGGGIDAPTIDGGGPGTDGPSGDACTPTGIEQCNGLDDDCDGDVDEEAAMVGSTCGTDTGPCQAGTYECQSGDLVCGGGAIAPVAESCNGIDDDCDGTPDDGDPGGGFVCGSDTGDCQRGVTACVGGSVICQGEVTPILELCDTQDNDCDGMFDEGNPEGGAACGTGMGACLPGSEQCIGGAVVCVGGTTPNPEVCDGADNDCDCPGDTNTDGTVCGPGDTNVDEVFDFANDPFHCGDCTTVCTAANGQAGCSNSMCTVLYCNTGYWDNNLDPNDGCEYQCNFQGAEVCNGLDDDCDCPGDTNMDGTVCGPGDTGVDEGLTPPSICNQIGECTGSFASCEGIDGWVCNYPSTVSLDAMNEIIPESDCDELDNDCDGFPDDFFPTKGDACQRGMGACRTTGTIVCNAAQDGVECNAPDGSGNSTAEICDGLDQNCNGVPDDGAPDAWVKLGAANIWVYQYEASRPDADDLTAGAMSHRPCSGPNRLPWANITYPQAQAQCASIGARLCTETEWESACSASSGTCDWSFGSMCTTYQDDVCNGNDYDFVPGGADDDGLLPTGPPTLASCYANWGGANNRIFDLSGNLKEWTAARSAGVNPLRGGSYNNTAVGLSCDFDFAVADDTFQFPNVGFRCCRTTAP